MRATRTLHELRRDKECLFACKSYDMKECLWGLIDRDLSVSKQIMGQNNILSGSKTLKIAMMGLMNCSNCDAYKIKI